MPCARASAGSATSVSVSRRLEHLLVVAPGAGLSASVSEGTPGRSLGRGFQRTLWQACRPVPHETDYDALAHSRSTMQAWRERRFGEMMLRNAGTRGPRFRGVWWAIPALRINSWEVLPMASKRS